MSDPQAQAAPEPQAPQAPTAPEPPAQAQQSSGGGGFFESFVQDFAEQMGVEWSDLELTDGPWLEQSQIGWRVHNAGNKDVPSHNIFIRISDGNGTIVEKDESKSEKVGPEEYKDFHLTVDDFNKKVQAELEMRGDSERMLSEDGRYRFDLFVDTASGYDKAGSVEFGVEVDEAAGAKKTKTHERRERIERKKREDGDGEDFDDPESEDVRHLQERLQKLGYYSGQVDGRYGDSTEEAVAAFKMYQGLNVDGKIVGERTWAALNTMSDEHDDADAPTKFRKAKGFTY